MKKRYHIDTAQYSLERFKHNLQSRTLIPSRVTLKEDLEVRFKVLETAGIANLKDLLAALKTKPKVDAFARETGLPSQYLTLLNREAKSYLPNPVRLDKFPGVPSGPVDRLTAEGIVNSRHLFNAAADQLGREQLALSTAIPLEVLDELVGLSDLARAYGVGPVFARIIYDVGIHSIQAFVSHSAQDFIRIYEAETGKKADFGVHEIQFSIDLAVELLN